MIKHVLKMSQWFLTLVIFNLVVVSNCQLHLIILEDIFYETPKPVSSVIERSAGSTFSLTCQIGGPGVFSEPELVWGRRTKELRFKNETDLEKLATEHSKALYDLHNNSVKYVSTAYRSFYPLKLSDRGAYFCMSLKYNLFKIIHIKVTEEEVDPFEDSEPYTKGHKVSCGKDKFRCETNGYCINLHYMCDGRSDCYDDSDEDWSVCKGDPCEGKIQCRDGRCIPKSWCCDRRTDKGCTVSIRPSCCPPLPDPYDPILWYHNQNDNDVKEMHKSNGSKYLFITVCVVSAILSFVLFLFVISKVCGFDAKPRSRNSDSSRNRQNEFTCAHSQCAIRREFSPNVRCLYGAGANRIQSTDNNNEVDDPLIIIGSIRAGSPIEVSDQPPSYAEVVMTPPNIDKSVLDDLFNAPPPPYASTNTFSETESRNENNISASDHVASNCTNDQSACCDIGTTGDNSNSNEC